MNEARTIAASFVDLIDARRDELVALTQDLIRIPTLNPPGEAYLEICEYLAGRLRARNFDIQMVRAHGTPGDSDRYPRWNVVARREGRGPGACVHFNSHIDVVENRPWLDDRPVWRRGEGRQDLRPRRLRHEGRVSPPRSSPPRPSSTARPDFNGAIENFRHGRRGNRRLWRRRLSGRKGLLRPAAGTARDHSRAAQQGPHLPRPSRRLVGRNRDQGPHRPRLHAVPWRLCGCVT